MTRRARLSAAFLCVLLLIAAINAVGVPVGTDESDETDVANPCRYTVTGGEVGGKLEGTSLTGMGLPTVQIDREAVMERDRAITTEGVSVAFETVQVTVENVTIENDSALGASVGNGRFHLHEVTVTGPGLPNAMITDETFVVRNRSSSPNGHGNAAEEVADTDASDRLRVSLENVTTRNTGSECLTNSGGV